MKQKNSSGFVKIITLLLCISGVTWLGFNLINKYLQIQQFKQANYLLAQNKYDSAITAYDKLLQTNVRQRHLLWTNRGYALSGLNQYNDMLQSCSAATLIKPQAALAWNCQGEALYYLGKYEAALKAFERATVINSQEVTFWLNKSRALYNLQQYRPALAASEQGIKFLERSTTKNQTYQRDFAIALNQKGQSLLQTNQYQQALTAFNQSLNNSPDYLSAQQGQGITLYKLGNHNQAIAAFDKILERDDLTKEQRAMSLLYKGISLCNAKKNVAAEEAFKEVLQLSTDRHFQKLAKAGCGIE